MTELPTYPAERKALHKALAAAQGEFPPIGKDKTVQVKTRDGQSYKFAYAELGTILAAVRPVLAKHGLALIQRLENPNGQPAIRTELLHSDGASLAASFPLGPLPGTPQQLGSLLTYLRRYAIVALLGIAAEEDDDGRQASGPATGDTTAPRSTGPEDSPQFTAPEPKPGGVVEDLTASQRRAIFAIRTKLLDAGAFTEDQWKEQLLKDYEIDSVSGLTKSQASDLIERLKQREDELDA